MKKYKTTLSDQHCEGLERLIEQLMKGKPGSIATRVTLSVLCEALIMIKKKRAEYKRTYRFSFTPAQALSLCCLYYECSQIINFGNDFMNRMHQLNNEILQHYSVC